MDTSSKSITVVNWSLTGLVLFLSGGRFAIRRISPGRWHWDDLAHLIALLILLAHGATNMLVLDVKDQLAASMSAAPTDESRVLALYQRLSYLDVVNDCLFFLCIWATKMAWLLLYYYLFRTSVNFRIAWWAVLGFVIVAFWAPVGGLIATCNWASSLSDYVYCNTLNFFVQTRLIYTCALDVMTDFAIMGLPLAMLYDLKIPLGQKLGLAGIFSLAFFCIVLDILRTVQSLQANAALYVILAINFNVLLSCLPAYRALFTMRSRGHGTPRSTGWTPRSTPHSSRVGRFARHKWTPSTSSTRSGLGISGLGGWRKPDMERSVSRSEVHAMRDGLGDQLSPTKIRVTNAVTIVGEQKTSGLATYVSEV